MKSIAKKRSAGEPPEEIWIEIERSRLNRENAMIVMNKGFMLFFVFLFAGIMGYTEGAISNTGLTVMIMISIAAFILVVVHEMHIMVREEGRLQRHIDKRIREDKK